MTTGEGGMIITNDDDLAVRLRRLRSHGMTSVTWDRHKGHAWSYDVVDLGFNYRLDEIRSALGRVQLSKLDGYNSRRRELTSLLRSLFSIMLVFQLAILCLYYCQKILIEYNLWAR